MCNSVAPSTGTYHSSWSIRGLYNDRGTWGQCTAVVLLTLLSKKCVFPFNSFIIQGKVAFILILVNTPTHANILKMFSPTLFMYRWGKQTKWEEEEIVIIITIFLCYSIIILHCHSYSLCVTAEWNIDFIVCS